MNKLKALPRMIKELLEDNHILFVFIVLMGINQLIYKHVPGALLLNLLILGLVLQVYNFRTRRLNWILASLFLVVLYFLGVFTNLEFLRASIYSISGLWIVLGLIFFTMKDENFLDSLYVGGFQISLALVYFLVLYGVIYLISFLIDQILFLNLPYDGVVFRLANSLASMLGLFVLFSKKKKPTMGSFFDPLFKKILPKLSLIFGVLALIYHIQILLGFINNYYSGVFYAIMALFFAAYLLSFWEEEDSREKQSILLLFILISLSHILIKLDPFKRVTSGYDTRGFYHDLLASGAIVIYGFMLFRDKARMSSFKWLAVFLSLVLLLPPLGYSLYEFYDFEDMTRRSSSIWQDFNRHLDLPQAEESDFVYFYSYSEGNSVLDVKGYSYLFELNFYNKEQTRFSHEDIEFSVEDRGKTLLVSRGGESESLDIYSEARKFQDLKVQNEEPLYYEMLGLEIWINNYSFDNYYFNLDLRVLVP